MKVRWQIKFASLQGTDYVIDYYDADYTGSSITQLTGAAEPFITNEDTDDDFFVPVRTQSGYIKFVAQNDAIVGDLMPVQATDRPVVLRTSGGTVCWIGFLSQEQYSQPWEPCPYEIEMPVVSVMMAMQGVRFTQNEGYTSLLSLMNTIRGYLPKAISAVISEASPIADVFVQNKNFHDAESGGGSILSASNDCDTIYACVEQFCLYFGVSLREYEGVFYFTISETENVHYEDMDLNGNTRQSQWGGIQLSQMTICGANNTRDYSTPYRRIKGEFDTGRDKAEVASVLGIAVEIDNTGQGELMVNDMERGLTWYIRQHHSLTLTMGNPDVAVLRISDSQGCQAHYVTIGAGSEMKPMNVAYEDEDFVAMPIYGDGDKRETVVSYTIIDRRTWEQRSMSPDEYYEFKRNRKH